MRNFPLKSWMTLISKLLSANYTCDKVDIMSCVVVGHQEEEDEGLKSFKVQIINFPLKSWMTLD